MQEFTQGRYTFRVHFPESETPQVFAFYDTKCLTQIWYHKSSSAFESHRVEKMTPSMLKALILSLFTFESVGTKSFKELTEKRIEAWVNSVRYTLKREKFAECPFGVY